MNIIQFNFKQIKSRPLSSVLNIILFATGVTIISLVFLLKDSFENQMDKNAGGIDLVVGAKGSPLQLILSGIYHVDYPTGNIDYNEAIELSKNPLIKQAIPLALGDNFNGFRIVGTNKAYPTIYNGQIQAGSLWLKDFEATIGSKVASKTGLAIGRQFAGVHGLSAESDDVHESTPYTVTGIFKETGTVLDQLILTNIESVWKIHDSHEHHHEHSEAEKDHDHTTDGGHEHDADSDHSQKEHEHEEGEHPKEITSLLIRYQSPMGAITLPRLINKSTNMQAASPVQEINRLYSLLGVGIEALTYISGFIILISALSILISLLNSLKERKYELALIRVMGGSRFRLFAIVILEGISFAIIGYIVGFVTSRFMMFVLSTYTDNNFNYTFQQWVTPIDLLLLIASLIIGIIAATIPAIKAMKTNISKTLSQ
ncbi:ABC transporter permease [Dysgonomonas capnocytophagoides]|uniref:ABC transporter permease n=1 Tax=Dysgonomonas capnocytophagoides TaxID=45254 RepID=A0A4Y8L0U0_9BACT|nr:ABC transporter permease [Dysgonomonas capnocytophagoides]TFD96339.1 ABC transporter permease [Dysgonomonas capnocytophagoides]